MEEELEEKMRREEQKRQAKEKIRNQKRLHQQMRECGMKEDELYNDGGAFKITCRDASGRVVTAIADNYFGYCKKEVKTQISFAANLYGLAEEEHAGGALVFPSFDLGEQFSLSDFRQEVDHTFAEVIERYGSYMDLQPEGYGIDKEYPSILYVPEDANISLREQTVSWSKVFCAATPINSCTNPWCRYVNLPTMTTAIFASTPCDASST